MSGPWEQRLRRMLVANEGAIRGAQIAWLDAEYSLEALDQHIASARDEIRGEGEHDAPKLGGRAGDRAVAALATFGAELQRHHGNLTKGASALADAAAAIEDARKRLRALGELGEAPTPPRVQPTWTEDRVLTEHEDHDKAARAWSAAAEDREEACRQAARDLEGQLERSTRTMQEIHGEPDPGPGGRPPPVAPVTHTPTGPSGPHTSPAPPGPAPSQVQLDVVHADETDYVLEPGGPPLIGAAPEAGGPDHGADHQPPDHGDPGPGHASDDEGGGGGPGLGTVGLAGAGLAGGAGLARGIARLAGGSPVSRAARLGPSAVQGTSGALGRKGATAGSPSRAGSAGRAASAGAAGAGRGGARGAGGAGSRGDRGAAAAAGRAGRTAKDGGGPGDGDIFDTEQDWYDDESQPGVLD